MYSSVTPIVPSRERKPEEGVLQARKPIDSKVKGFVLERIAHARGGLLPSATAPQVILNLLPVFDPKMELRPREKRKSRLRKSLQVRRIPIGLQPVDPEGWVNALMQFILFIPGLIELLFFAPRSLYPVQEFVDQYHLDQQENKMQSTANGVLLFRFFRLKLPSLTLLEIFEFLVRILKGDWKIHRNWEEALQNEHPSDLFVISGFSKKQVHVNNFFYDLNAFIELRPDGSSENYITYVKVEGSWYQCDNDRIAHLRSNSLSIPLSRGILHHYKRINF